MEDPVKRKVGYQPWIEVYSIINDPAYRSSKLADTMRQHPGLGAQLDLFLGQGHH